MVESASAKYERGPRLTRKHLAKVGNPKAKKILRRDEATIREAIKEAMRAEMLMTDSAGFLEAEGLEHTRNITQDELKSHVNAISASKMFDLRLEHGPYSLDYTRGGRHMLIGGLNGHVAGFDWQNGKLRCELNLADKVYDIKWLQNETLFAAAQSKYVYIYDQAGIELHRMKKHLEARRLEFLPYHYLLASAGAHDFLRYQDVSTGELVAELQTNLGECISLAQNPRNAILHTAHASGTVALWSPALNSPLVRMLCHRGPVQAVAVDLAGVHMVTAGLDGALRVWDMRTFRPFSQYYTQRPVHALSISQRGMLAVGHGAHVTVWKDAMRVKQQSPYMTHLFGGETVSGLRFCPFEDILGVAHGSGITSLLIPGAGEPNYDSLEANPFQTKKQRQEAEVKQLLDKLQPDSIVLDVDLIGSVDRTSPEAIAAEKALEGLANHESPRKPAGKARGRSTALRRYQKKHANIVDSYKLKSKEGARIEVLKDQVREKELRPKSALDRFVSRSLL